MPAPGCPHSRDCQGPCLLLPPHVLPSFNLPPFQPLFSRLPPDGAQGTLTWSPALETEVTSEPPAPCSWAAVIISTGRLLNVVAVSWPLKEAEKLPSPGSLSFSGRHRDWLRPVATSPSGLGVWPSPPCPIWLICRNVLWGAGLGGETVCTGVSATPGCGLKQIGLRLSPRWPICRALRSNLCLAVLCI